MDVCISTGGPGGASVAIVDVNEAAAQEVAKGLPSGRALERLLSDGRVRAVAVSNFRVEDLDRLAEHTEIVPAINQIEVHPYFQQRELRAANTERGILTQAWSPIGGIYINHPRDVLDPVLLLADPVLCEIATRIGRTTAQIVLRWHFQNGIAVIPKSVFPERIASNFRIFDFELEAADMARIDGLERGLRGGGDPATFDTRYLRERARR